MRIRFVPELATALILLGTAVTIARPARADEGPSDVTWKLVALAYGDDEFAIFKVTEKDGKTAATIVDSQRRLGLNELKAAERKDGVLTFTITGPVGETTFKGKLAKEGPDAGQYLGTTQLSRFALPPARLEETKASKVAELKQSSPGN